MVKKGTTALKKREPKEESAPLSSKTETSIQSRSGLLESDSTFDFDFQKTILKKLKHEEAQTPKQTEAAALINSPLSFRGVFGGEHQTVIENDNNHHHHPRRKGTLAQFALPCEAPPKRGRPRSKSKLGIEGVVAPPPPVQEDVLLQKQAPMTEPDAPEKTQQPKNTKSTRSKKNSSTLQDTKTKTGETKTGETKTEETKTEETKTEETKPREAKSRETKTEETKTEETKPREAKPRETKPRETKPRSKKTSNVSADKESSGLPPSRIFTVPKTILEELPTSAEAKLPKKPLSVPLSTANNTKKKESAKPLSKFLLCESSESVFPEITQQSDTSSRLILTEHQKEELAKREEGVFLMSLTNDTPRDFSSQSGTSSSLTFHKIFEKNPKID